MRDLREEKFNIAKTKTRKATDCSTRLAYSALLDRDRFKLGECDSFDVVTSSLLSDVRRFRDDFDTNFRLRAGEQSRKRDIVDTSRDFIARDDTTSSMTSAERERSGGRQSGVTSQSRCVFDEVWRVFGVEVET